MPRPRRMSRFSNGIDVTCPQWIASRDGSVTPMRRRYAARSTPAAYSLLRDLVGHVDLEVRLVDAPEEVQRVLAGRERLQHHPEPVADAEAIALGDAARVRLDRADPGEEVVVGARRRGPREHRRGRAVRLDVVERLAVDGDLEGHGETVVAAVRALGEL